MKKTFHLLTRIQLDINIKTLDTFLWLLGNDSIHQLREVIHSLKVHEIFYSTVVVVPDIWKSQIPKRI